MRPQIRQSVGTSLWGQKLFPLLCWRGGLEEVEEEEGEEEEGEERAFGGREHPPGGRRRLRQCWQ